MRKNIDVLRCIAIMLVAGLLCWVLLHSDRGRSKGTPIPLPNLFFSLAGATIAALVTRRAWRGVAAPFVAGIVGSFAAFDPHSGPYGAFTGFLIGLIVALLPRAWLIRPARVQST